MLLACYLVFTSRMSADQAILFVRAKRPNSIQTRGQLLCVREFAQFLVPLRSIFSCAEPKASAVTLSQYLTRQRHLLHGYEARQMRNVPKILQLVCRLLVDIAANRQVVMEAQIPDLTAEVEKTVSQQALQQLGKEMRGKGITVQPCSSLPLSPPALHSRAPPDEPLSGDNELLPLQASLSNCRSLSYSDSVLDKRVQQQQHLGPPKSNTPINCRIKHSVSHSSLTVGVPPRCDDFSPQDIISSIQGFNMEAKQDNGSSLFKKQLHEGHQGLSLDPSKQGRTCQCAATLPALSTRSEVDVSAGVQSDLSPEGRCLLVAQALAMDQADKDFTSEVSIWQVVNPT